MTVVDMKLTAAFPQKQRSRYSGKLYFYNFKTFENIFFFVRIETVDISIAVKEWLDNTISLVITSSMGLLQRICHWFKKILNSENIRIAVDDLQLHTDYSHPSIYRPPIYRVP